MAPQEDIIPAQGRGNTDGAHLCDDNGGERGGIGYIGTFLLIIMYRGKTYFGQQLIL